MKIQIECYVFRKVKVSDVEINIPEEPIFFQSYNLREVTGIFPQFSVSNPNQIWELKIVQIEEDSITTAYVRVNPDSLSRIVSHFKIKKLTRQDSLVDEVVMYLKDHFDTDRISKETFENKLYDRVKRLKNLLQSGSHRKNNILRDRNDREYKQDQNDSERN